MPSSPLRAAALAASALVLLATPFAAGQVGTFGTWVRMGDNDYDPLLKGTADTDPTHPLMGATEFKDKAAPLYVYRSNRGDPDSVSDDCLILDTFTNNGASAPAFDDAPLKDLRITDCEDKVAGTLVAAADETDMEAMWTLQGAVTAGTGLVDTLKTRYADVNENTKYDAGEPVYLIYTAAGAPTALVATEADPAGDWSLRLTPSGSHAAGTFVRNTDDDFDLYGPLTRSTDFSLVEREDKNWYLINSAAATTASSVKNLPLPVKSIRLGPVGVAANQPLVQVSSVQLPDAAPQAGEEYKVLVRYSNDGKEAGPGLLVTRLDGQIADARLTPWLSPGEAGSALLPIEMPEHGGEVRLDVAGFKVGLEVDGPLPGTDGSGGSDQVAALEARIAQLEQQLAGLDAAAAASKTSTASASRGSPGPGTALVVVALAALATAVRRRG